MTITQLEYIIAVAKHHNFTKAAESCFVTQPTLSMQVQKLEQELGVIIFDRKTKPLEVTPIGKKIVMQAQKIVNEAKRMQDIVDLEKGFIGGDFDLGIIPTVMPTLLPMFLRVFTKRFPNVNLKIHELTTQKILQQIKDGVLDAGIAVTPLKEEQITERALFNEPFVAYIPEHFDVHYKDKLDVEDLDLSKILLLEDGHCFSQGVLNLCSASRQVRSEGFQLESGSFETLIKLSDEGLGLTLLPYLHTKDVRNKKNLKYFNEPYPAREVSLIYSKHELKPQIINVLHKVILETVKDNLIFENVKIISPI